MSTILVLGANGFVGRRLVEALAATDGVRPVAVIRREAKGLPAGVETRGCDAMDEASLKVAVAGADAIVNCVAGSDAALVGSARNLVAVAGPARIVHLSSMAVYGAAQGLVDEDAPLDAAAAGYAGAKVEAERVCAAHSAAGGDVVVLRPGCIHGPGGEPWTARIARLLSAGRLGDLGAAGDGFCNLSYIDDVTSAVEAALRRPEARGRVYNVSDPEPDRWNAYFTALGRAIGAVPVARIGARRLKMEAVAALPLRLLERAAQMSRLRVAAPDAIPPSLLRLWRQEIRLDPARADRELAFRRTPPAAALAASAAWFTASESGGLR